MSIPVIKLVNNKKVLFVDDKPFFMISGEIHNSSSSSIEYLDPILAKLEDLGLNSVLLPITWQMIEPKENEFELDIVADIIKCAESHNLKLGILWFGTWKNAQMSYTPSWVKEDTNRFKRAELQKGKHQIIRKSLLMNMPFTTISPFSTECMKADAKAFKTLMSYIKDIDINHTIITVQVENETGFLGGDFDYSDESLSLYNKDVPEDFIKYLEGFKGHLDKKIIPKKNKGTWKEVFKKNSHEVFIAYYISKYVEYVAKAGKEVYPLPFGVNCWLDAKGMKAGKYPSGGPIAKVMEVWMYNCKDIDYYSPDNYLYDFYQILDEFNKNDNPIYVPESKVCSKAVSREMYIMGHYHGMCYAGFGIEDIGNELKIDFSRFAWMLGFSVDSHKSYPQDINLYRDVNNLLNGAMHEIMKHYGSSDLECFSKERNRNKTSWIKVFDNIEYKTLMVPFIKTKDSANLICKLNDNEFLILGYGTMSFFKSLDKVNPYIEYLSIEEGYYKDDKWVVKRVLNGDEEMILQLKPSLLKVKVHTYN